jgi:hypothetical protein
VGDVAGTADCFAGQIAQCQEKNVTTVSKMAGRNLMYGIVNSLNMTNPNAIVIRA